MFLIDTNAGPCRTAKLPVCEANSDASQSAPILALGEFQIRKRDTLDFSVDATDWLAANGNAQLAGASWSVAGDSPKTPVLGDSAYSPQGKTSVVVTPAADALAGDAYWLDVTLNIGATVATGGGEVALPARTVVRRIYIVVVNG